MSKFSKHIIAYFLSYLIPDAASKHYFVSFKIDSIFKAESFRIRQLTWHGFNPLSPHDALKHIFTSLYNFFPTRGFMMKISLKLFYQYMAIFFNFSPTSSHLHPLQVENCGSNSRLVVDDMTMVNSGSKGLTLKAPKSFCINHGDQRVFQFEIIIHVILSSSRFAWIPAIIQL